MTEGRSCGCSSKVIASGRGCACSTIAVENRKSELKHWPVQLSLVSPTSLFLQETDLVLATDCVAYAIDNSHAIFQKDNSLAIACPKLEGHQEIYTDKLKALIEESNINTLTVVSMEAPCCTSMLNIAQTSIATANKKVPLKSVTINTTGDVLRENWL